MTSLPVIGISACLTGMQVRYDKSHKRHDFCLNELARHVSYRPFCPEVAIGLPTPRPTIRQIRKGDVIHVSRPDGSGDVTAALTDYGRKVASDIEDLAGFVFCAKSPSCGMERVKVYHENGLGSESNGIGQFAAQIMAAHPQLPCEESGRLNDPHLRENFVTRVFTYHQWLQLKREGLTKGKLIAFHSRHKYLLMAHHRVTYQRLGQLLAQSELPLDALAQEYILGLMAGLKQLASRKTHCSTLQHLQGYFKRQLSAQQKAELGQRIEQYRQGLVPLLVPLTLIEHYLREHPNDYLLQQRYLAPYPADLRLRYGY